MSILELENESLKNTILIKQNEIENITAEKNSLISRIKELLNNLEETKGQVISYETKQEMQQKEIANLVLQITSKNLEIKEVASQRDAVSIQLNNLNIENNYIKKDVEKMKCDIEKKSIQIIEQEKEIERLKSITWIQKLFGKK